MKTLFKSVPRSEALLSIKIPQKQIFFYNRYTSANRIFLQKQKELVNFDFWFKNL